MSKIENILKIYLLFGGFYFITEAIIHISNIKLISVESFWPKSAYLYARLINQLYGLSALFISGLSLIALTDIYKYKKTIIFAAFWALIHGLYLIYISLSEDFVKTFSETPSLNLWSDFYNIFLGLEAAMLIGYTSVVYLWVSKGSK